MSGLCYLQATQLGTSKLHMLAIASKFVGLPESPGVSINAQCAFLWVPGYDGFLQKARGS